MSKTTQNNGEQRNAFYTSWKPLTPTFGDRTFLNKKTLWNILRQPIETMSKTTKLNDLSNENNQTQPKTKRNWSILNNWNNLNQPKQLEPLKTALHIFQSGDVVVELRRTLARLRRIVRSSPHSRQRTKNHLTPPKTSLKNQPKNNIKQLGTNHTDFRHGSIWAVWNNNKKHWNN